MRSSPTVVVLLVIAACASPAPSPAEVSPQPTAQRPIVDCGELDETLCASVTDAAQLMTGTAPLEVAVLPIPSGGGTPIEERYVVTLEPESGSGEPQLVEVVRFQESDNWSVRRLDRMPDG